MVTVVSVQLQVLELYEHKYSLKVAPPHALNITPSAPMFTIVNLWYRAMLLVSAAISLVHFSSNSLLMSFH